MDKQGKDVVGVGGRQHDRTSEESQSPHGRGFPAIAWSQTLEFPEGNRVWYPLDGNRIW